MKMRMKPDYTFNRMLTHCRPLLLAGAFLLPGQAWSVEEESTEAAAGVAAVPESASVAASEEQARRARAAALQELDELFVVGSKERAFTLPGSAFYLDEGDITNLNYQDINQVLRQIPGVYVRNEDGYGNFPNISLRGVNGNRSSKVTMMEDGVLTSPAPYSAPAAYYSPAVGRMHGLEVLMGSSQVKYGPETTGGVLNYISTPIPLEPNQVFGRFSFGNYNDYQTHVWAGGTYDVPGGELGILGEFYNRQTDGFQQLDSTTGFQAGDANTGFNRKDYMVKVSFIPDWKTFNYFEFKLGYTDFDANETYLGVSQQDFASTPNRRYAGSRYDQINTYGTRMYLRYMVEPNDQVRFSSTAYYQHFHRNWYKLHELRGPNVPLAETLFDGTPAYNVITGQAAGTLRYRANNRDYNLYGIQNDIDVNFETGPVSHELEAGLRFHYDSEERFQHNDDYTQNAQGVFTGLTRGAPGSQDNRKGSTFAIASYVQDRISYEQFAVIPGLRYEYIDYSTNNRNTGAQGSSTMNVVTPGVGLEYNIDPNWMIFGGYYMGFSAPGPGGAVAGLKKETSNGFEVGARYADGKGIRAELIGFYTLFDNLVVQQSVGSGGIDENVGDATSRGIEALIGVDPARMTGQGFNSPITMAVTYTDAYLTSNTPSGNAESIFAGATSGNRMPGIPDWQFNITGGLEFERVRGYASFTYVASSYATGSNATNQINPVSGNPDARFGMLDAFATLDLSIYFKVWRDVEIFGYAQNVLNREYIASRLPSGPRPGAPAMYGIGVQASF